MTLEELEARIQELERWREHEQRIMLQSILEAQSEAGRRLTNVENAVIHLTREVGNGNLSITALDQKVDAVAQLAANGFARLEAQLALLTQTRDDEPGSTDTPSG